MSLKALRLNHHRASGANDGGGASTSSRMDDRNNSGDGNKGNNPRRIPDKGRCMRVRPIYRSNRQPSLSEARKQQAQALAELGVDIFS